MAEKQPLKRVNFHFDWSISSYKPKIKFIFRVEMGHASQKASAPQQLLSVTPLTGGHPVEAECVVDDRVFTGISEPHIPELRN